MEILIPTTVAIAVADEDHSLCAPWCDFFEDHSTSGGMAFCRRHSPKGKPGQGHTKLRAHKDLVYRPLYPVKVSEGVSTTKEGYAHPMRLRCAACIKETR